MKSKSFISLTAAALTAVAGAFAGAAPAGAEEAQDAINARRGYFQMLSFNLGGLAAMAKGEREYNALAAAKFAANLDALSDVDLSMMFVDGTDNQTMAGKTRAKPEIWTNFEGVDKRSEDFNAAIDLLTVDAAKGLEALRGRIGQVGGACKACHDDFRAKDF